MRIAFLTAGGIAPCLSASIGGLIEQYNRLADLATVVRDNPVTGVAAYKPPNSEAGVDINIIDHIGMLGVPIVPVSVYPRSAPVIFLPTQAAADPEIATEIDASLQRGSRVIVTRGFLTAMSAGRVITPPNRTKAEAVTFNATQTPIDPPLNVASGPDAAVSTALLNANVNGEPVPFLTHSNIGRGQLHVLNTYTYTQEDFDAVNEVLLAPQPLGLMNIPQEWADTIRRTFIEPLGYKFNAPARVTFQPLGDSGCVIQNYRNEPISFELEWPKSFDGVVIDGFTGEPLETSGASFRAQLSARDRMWLLAL